MEDVSYKVQHLQQLQLADRPLGHYKDETLGPVRPGFGFYKWLFLGAPLQVPVAETVLIEKDVVRVLRTGPDGFLLRETVSYQRQQDRDAFVSGCIDRFVGSSRPVGQFPQSLLLQDRFVAVAKRAGGRPDQPVASSSELLIPSYFHAMLVEALDNKTQSLALQRFIKSRGGKAGFYRVFWKATACGARPAGTLAGWFVSRSDADFLAVEREDSPHRDDDGPGPLLSAQERQRGAHASSSERAALERRLAAANARCLAEMQAKPDMSLSERALAISVGQRASRAAEWANLCSLSPPALEGGPAQGGLSARTVQDTATSRVQRKALDEVRVYMDRLVQWLQNTLLLLESLVFHVADMACDFVRDDDGRWWLLQVKGFDVSPATSLRCRAWHSLRAAGEADALLRARRAAAELTRHKLEAERGLKCRMCGLNFFDEQTVLVETSEAEPASGARGDREREAGGRRRKGAVGTRPRTAPAAAASPGKGASPAFKGLDGAPPPRVVTRSVPAFGYDLSRKMGCRLSELLRDCGFPLTKFSRALLLGGSSVADARTVADKFRDQELLELSRSSGGEITCCFFCHRVVSEMEGGWALALQLARRLQQGNTAAPRTTEGGERAEGLRTAEEREEAFVRRTGSPGPPGAGSPGATDAVVSLQIERTPLTSTAPAQPKNKGPSALTGGGGLHVKDSDGGFTLDPWSTRHFRRGTHQFRLLVMAQHVLDLRLPTAHALHDKVAKLCYRLGQLSCSLPFRLVQQGGEFADHPTVWVRQARLHYLCGTMADVKAFLRAKTLHVDVAVGTGLPREGAGPGEEREEWLGSLQVPLGKLSLSNTAGYTDGSEKADYSLAAHLRGLGPATFALSVALVRDELLPWQLEGCASFYKEGQVFWPAADYSDAAPLPAPWLAMMQCSQRDRDRATQREEEERGAAGARAGAGDQGSAEEKDGAGAAVLRGDLGKQDGGKAAVEEEEEDGEDEDGDEAEEGKAVLDRKRRRSDVGLPAAMVQARELFAALAAQQAAEEGDAPGDGGPGLTWSGGETKAAVKQQKQKQKVEEEDDDEEEGEDRFGDDESGGGSSSGSDDYDYDDKVRTYTLLGALFEALRAREEAGQTRTHDDEGREVVVRTERLSEGHVLMRLALEQLLQQEHLPEAVSWKDAEALLGECITWAKTQRGKIQLAAKAGPKPEPRRPDLMQQGLGQPTSGSGGGAVVMDKAWVRTNEARLAMYGAQFPGSALDPACSSGEVVTRPRARTAHLGKERENFRVLPSSAARKQRRMLTALSIFDRASGGSETLTAAALLEFAMRERGRLLRLLGLVQEGEISFSRVPRAFLDALSEPFCLTRAVLCCHLAVSSEQLRALVDTDPQSELGRTGFLRAVEEAVFNVTNRLTEHALLGEDPVVAELMLLATESELTMQNSDAHAFRRRGNFSLGLADGAAGEVMRRASLDVAGVLSRRRSSRLSELADMDAKTNKRLDKAEPPTIFLFCDMHGVERFFLADLQCCLCEREHITDARL